MGMMLSFLRTAHPIGPGERGPIPHRDRGPTNVTCKRSHVLMLERGAAHRPGSARTIEKVSNGRRSLAPRGR